MPCAIELPCCSTSASWWVPWKRCSHTITRGSGNISMGPAAGLLSRRSKERRMEKRAPYVLIGAAVMLFIAATVGFVIWKLRAGDQRAYAYYNILFSGDVQGLTPDSPVYYRGLRV